MKKNKMGVIVTVKSPSEYGDNMVHCSVCNADAIVSYDCDFFRLDDKADAEGEAPLICEKCLVNAHGGHSIDLGKMFSGK